MHPDDLKTIWECYECGRKFFYHSDISGHVKESGHSKVVSKDATRRKSDAVFIRKNISLSFKVEGRTAKLLVECKYYPATEAIVYTSVNYSDKRLQRMIEGKPDMMSKVDSYLKQLFHTEKESNSSL